MTELARIAPPPPNTATEQLRHALADLTPSEQAVLARMVMAAKFDENGRAEIDEISLVREFLVLDPSQGPPSTPRGGMPPLIKPYAGRPFVAFPEERVPFDDTLSDVLKRRKSHRDYQRKPIELKLLATLLESGYGLTRYMTAYGERRFPFRRCVRACLAQDWIGESAAMLFLTCDLRKLLWKYGRRAFRMSHVDAGVVAQQFHLIATALGLGSCMIAGFMEEAVHKLLDIDGKLEFAALGICLGVPVDAPSF